VERITGANSGFKKLAVQWLNEVQFSNGTFWWQTVYGSEIANFFNPQTVSEQVYEKTIKRQIREQP
jgi:hypothetical protein